MTVGHFMVESTGTLSELDRVKLSGRVPGHNGFIAWAGNSLAILTGIFFKIIFVTSPRQSTPLFPANYNLN